MATVKEQPSFDTSTNVLTITRPAPSRQPSTQSIDARSPLEDADSAHFLTTSRTVHSEKSAIMPQGATFNDSKAEIIETKSCPMSDLEAGLMETATRGSADRILKKKCNEGDDPWPCPRALKRQRKAAKRSKACCACWGDLGKRQKLTVKVVSGVAIVAIIVVMCILISKAVGGGVWSKGQTQAPIKGT
ncbi:uncharacterized protein BP5553_01190 [Venustampulla echinocandica]|uniref:Uncharacterized protein n=1 Tax=Venustampulla echinocandica TaxID=2656787 RepID=A0A370U0A9_9HELO|nr:uncharacterized protein BP5553_01190 [Venustampulla echinocandica]RDL41211.1 hypothetical protein BP5553_01190 [Venustampulla echinocandica]